MKQKNVFDDDSMVETWLEMHYNCKILTSCKSKTGSRHHHQVSGAAYKEE